MGGETGSEAVDARIAALGGWRSDRIDEAALKALVRAAVDANLTGGA
jgi:hypothetical protein